MNLSERINKVVYDSWLLMEPALYAVLYKHEVTPVNGLLTPVRAGRGRIEYSPQLLDGMHDREIEELFRIEAIRILLKHPYSRQPDASGPVRSLASDLTLASDYSPTFAKLKHPASFDLPSGECFEWYANALDDSDAPQKDNAGGGTDDDEKDGQKDRRDYDDRNGDKDRDGIESSTGKSDENADSADNCGNNPDDGSGDTNTGGDTGDSSSSSPSGSAEWQKSELWEDNEIFLNELNETIRNLKSWGSIPGNLAAKIIASTTATVDYRKSLAGFRASIISSRRQLTRMRPNRRTGFTNMGSIYRLMTNLLVAVDASGSVSDKSLADFYSIINRFFKYGVERIDTMQFDCALGDVVSLRKAKRAIDVHGRGGTDFQLVFDFFADHHEYDGLIVFTDGYAPTPTKKDNRNVLWILTSKKEYDECAPSLLPTGRVCYIDFPGSRHSPSHP